MFGSMKIKYCKILRNPDISLFTIDAFVPIKGEKTGEDTTVVVMRTIRSFCSSGSPRF